MFRKNCVFFSKLLQPLPRIHRCKNPSMLSIQCDCKVNPFGWYFFVQPIAAECWRGRGGKLSRILGKNTIFNEHPVLQQLKICLSQIIFFKDQMTSIDNSSEHLLDDQTCSIYLFKALTLTEERQKVERNGCFLLEVKLPYQPVCPSVGLSKFSRRAESFTSMLILKHSLYFNASPPLTH